MAERALTHHGILGQRWGVRRFENKDGSLTPAGIKRYADDEANTTTNKNHSISNIPLSSKKNTKSLEKNPYKINKDGSVEIKAGAQLQRVLTKTGKDSNSSTDYGIDGATYVSFTKGDNLKYGYYYGKAGRKGFFKRPASEIVTLNATQTLKSPSPGDAAKEFLSILKNNPEAVKILKKEVKDNIFVNEKDIDMALANPSSKAAHNVYSAAYDISVYNPSLKGIRDNFSNNLKKKGYNMIMDPSDSTFGEYDLPMVLLDGPSSTKIAGREYVTKESRKKLKSMLTEYENTTEDVKTFMESLGFTT